MSGIRDVAGELVRAAAAVKLGLFEKAQRYAGWLTRYTEGEVILEQVPADLREWVVEAAEDIRRQTEGTCA
jgi:hypothetical protein